MPYIQRAVNLQLAMEQIVIHDELVHEQNFMSISELSRRFGVTLRTLRFYEQVGLLRPLRVGNQRFYAPKDQIRLELILTGKRLGFSLRQVERLICSRQALRDDSNPPKLVDALDDETIERQMKALERQRDTLEVAISELRQALERQT